jgi:hypothetical protein
MASRPKTPITDFRHLPEVDADELVAGRSLPAFLIAIEGDLDCRYAESEGGSSVEFS